MADPNLNPEMLNGAAKSAEDETYRLLLRQLGYGMGDQYGNNRQFNAAGMPHKGESIQDWLSRIETESPDTYKKWANQLDPTHKGASYQGMGGGALPLSPVALSIAKLFRHNSGDFSENKAGDAAGSTFKSEPKAEAADQSKIDRQKAIDEFYKMMMDPNAPELQAAQRQAEAKMDHSNVGKGIGGGMAASATGRAGIQARGALQFQRQQAGMGALTTGMGLGNSSRGLDMQGQGMAFDQNQSNAINKANQDRAMLNAGIAGAGQISSLVLGGMKQGAGQGASGGGTGGMTGGYESPAAGMTPDYQAPADYGGGGAGGGSSPDEWSNPYGGGY